MDNAALQRLWQHARALHNAGHLIEASQAYLSLLQAAPANAAVLYNLGLVYQALGRFDDARLAYERTIAINPGLAQAHNNLGNALQALQRRADALAAYARALELDASLAPAAYNKAQMELGLGRLTDAVASLLRTTELDPANSAAWNQLFGTLLGLKRKQEAIDVFTRWEAAVPPSVALVSAGLIVSRLTGDANRERRYTELVDRWPFADASAEELMPLIGNLAYFDVRRETELACYQRFDRALQLPRGEKARLLPRRAPGRLRVGYVSADFRRHVMGRILLDIISAHDRDRVDVFLVSLCDPRFHDDTTRRFRELATGFADISALDDRQAALAIAEADLDLLVDLAAHTQAARPALYAWQPARHIVTHLGYHGCIGLRQVQYKLTDRLVEAADSARYQIEQPYYLDACFIPLSPVPPAGTTAAIDRRAELRREWGLEGKFVFAVFVGLIKLSPACLAAWKEILQATPGAVLAFSPFDGEDRALIRRATAAAGIDAAQVVMIDADPAADEATLRDRYLAADAVLDTFPYAGGDTTLAALDRDLPVVTLCGERTPARTGYSILSHLGVTGTIALDVAQYVSIASRLVREPAWLAELRQSIARARGQPNGLSVARHAAALEQAFIDIARIDQQPAGSRPAREFHRQFQETLKAHQSLAATADADEIRGQLDRAYAALLDEQPDFAPALYARGMLAQERGQVEQAFALLAHAVEAEPDDDAARLALAALMLEAGQAREVVDLLQPIAAVTSRPGPVNALLARACVGLEQWQLAESAARRAVDATPADVQATFTLGLALTHLGRPPEALAMFNRTLGLQETHVEAAYNAALLIEDGGDAGTAESLYRRVLANDPRHELAHWRLTGLLRRGGRADDGIAAAGDFARRCPDSLRARLRLAQARRDSGDLEDEGRQLRALAGELLSADRQGSEHDAGLEELLRLMLAIAPHIDADTELLKQLMRRSVRATAAVYGPPREKAGARRAGPIRVGYLVNRQPGTMAAAMTAWLAARHDRHRFEVYIYRLDAGDPDSSAARTLSMTGWSSTRVVEAIAAHDLDLLVDTTRLDDEKSAAVIAQRPARVTVCLPWDEAHPARPADYRFAARDSELPAAATVLPALPQVLPRALFPWPGGERQADPRFSRAAMGLPADLVVFAVLAPLERVSLRCLAIWKSILDAQPAVALLVMVPNPHIAPAWQRVFQAAGIDFKRMLMVDATASSMRMRDFSTVVDAVLDTVPTSDVPSVLDAIACGLPVITQAGPLPAERGGMSLLAGLGVTDTVVASGAEYLECASRLASDPAWRGSLAARIRAALPDSSLNDAAGYVRDLEDGLMEMVQQVPADGGNGSDPSP